MFDSLKSMGALAGIMKDMPRIKAKMDEVKQRLGEIVVDAETGGGAVRASADGQMHLVGLEIDQAMMSGLVNSSDDDDRAMAQDLIIGAVNAAMAKAREAAQQEISAAAEELGLPIPGGMGGGMGGLGGLLT